ncbi:uncharacterized protein FOMMEDRAFT_31429 [Fomitiporia mediterranea MF3/22]|uniref:uncharacterized protein n=1 Tax=Fomitiporia mediterranea (strain MF3/22) TaxID=694068 RepID=UPI00044083C8|nr:uncharacterized protein FOMMEDRAFT_31429 [Fomitiporia mediterranea MF3/22]EJC99391.1 hypothetical protein FOMMEDRAFT_31429 [Fomitiporia mediterranea MF3/22]
MQKQLCDSLNRVNARIENVNVKVEGYYNEHKVCINNVELALITKQTINVAYSYTNGNRVQADDLANDQADDQANEEVEVDSPDVEDCEIQFIKYYLSEKAEKDKWFCWYNFYYKMFKGPKAEEIGSKLVQVHKIIMARFHPVKASKTSNKGTPEEKVWEEAEANVYHTSAPVACVITKTYKGQVIRFRSEVIPVI